MRIPPLAAITGLLCLLTACVANEETRAAEARLAQQQLEKAVRDTATVAGLHGLVLREYRRAEYGQASADLKLLRRRYPHAAVLEALAPLAGRLDSLAAAQQQREAARQQRQAQELLPAPLAWQLTEYPDEFGQPSGRLALANADILRGTTLTLTDRVVGSPLVARLLVDSSAAIHLLLYDQVPTVPPPVRRRHHLRHRHQHAAPADTVAAYTTSYAAMHQLRVAAPTSFTVKVRHQGHITTLPATMLADRLVFTGANSQVLHECLLQGGEVGFLISPAGTALTISYRFTIANADAYEAGYHRLLRR